MLTASENVVLKNKLMGGDIDLMIAIDKYDAGDSSALEDILKDYLLGDERKHENNPRKVSTAQQESNVAPGRSRTISIDLLNELELDDNDLTADVISKPPPSAEVLGLPHDDQLMDFDMEMPFFYTSSNLQSPTAFTTQSVSDGQHFQQHKHQVEEEYTKSTNTVQNIIPSQQKENSTQKQQQQDMNKINHYTIRQSTIIAANTVGTTNTKNSNVIHLDQHRGGVSVIATNDLPTQRAQQYSIAARKMSISSIDGAPPITNDDLLYRRCPSTENVLRFSEYIENDIGSFGSTSSAHRSDYTADGYHRFGGKTAPGLRDGTRRTTRYGDRSRHRPSPSGVASSLNDALNNMHDTSPTALAYDGPISSTVTIPPDASLLNPGPSPAYEALVNFPRAKSRAQIHCVMCGRVPRECADGLARQAHFDGDEKRPDGPVVIPRQNKDVCRDCDKALWRHLETDTHFKWCKGCKRFRNLVAFAEKLAASKCDRCRERGRQGYQRRKGGTGSPPGTPVHRLDYDL